MFANFKSIRTSFYFTVILTVAAVCTIFGFVNFKLDEAKKISDLEGLADLSSERLSVNLAIPMWNINPGLIKTLIDAELKEPNVALITVLDEDRSSVIVSRKESSDGSFVDAPDADVSGYILRTKDVVHKKDLVGEVHVYLSDKIVREELKSGLLNTLMLTVVLIAVLCLIIGISLNRLVVSPVIALSNVASKMAKGDFSQQIRVSGNGELASLASNLKRLQSSFIIALKRLQKAKAA